jgi:hypothetical protein
MKCRVTWGANFTGVPVEGLSGLVHDGDTMTIQQQQKQKQNNNAEKFLVANVKSVLVSESSRNLLNHT